MIDIKLSILKQQSFHLSLMISVGQKFQKALTGLFWLRIFQAVAVTGTGAGTMTEW